MLHPKTDGVSFSTFSVLLYIIFFIPCVGVEFKIISSDQPIIALAGDDVILPCHLRPSISASYMTVMWTRPDLIPEYIHFHQDGHLLSETQNPSYFLRTGLFLEELPRGNVSIKIIKVKISDAGRYICKLPSLGKEAPVQLIVGAVSSPFIEIVSDNNEHVVLQCESTGWYPEPEVFWLDGEGNLLSAGPTETVRGPDDLYTVSSRVTVEKRHSNSFTCRVQQNHINQTREAKIHVPDDFFTGPSGSSSSLPVIIGLILCIVFVLVAAAAVVVWKWRQNKIRNKKQREDEEGGNSPELKLLMGGDTDGKQPTEETETVNNVDEFRGEPGQTETDEETLQQEANNAQCAESEGTELQFTQEAGGQTTRETQTGLDQSQEETETEAVTETDSLHPVSTNLNNKDTKTVTMVEERHKDNNQQTAEKKGAQSLKERDKHGEQPKVETADTNVHRNNEATSPQYQTDAQTPQIEQNDAKGAVTDGTEPQFTVRDGQRDPSLAEGEIGNGLEKSQDETEIKPVKAGDVPDPARNDPNNKEHENKNTSDNTEKPQEGQTDNKQQVEEENRKKCAADETEAQSLTEEDKHGEQQTAERETLRDREKENLQKELKTKERELEKNVRYVSRYERQMKDKEEQITEVKQQLEEVKRQREETERTMRSVKKKDKDYKHFLVLNKKEEELQEQLEKLETQLEGIKKTREYVKTKEKKSNK
ncbi:DNA ligase 1-like [Sparus aurata]|uniref:DNA ligase 1-like n=1 Tax=Sparus aurata TaxID=8175 RepID=UPI0011C0CCDD|nr:DNA ligase 1-like [Sparus aurata]XP_030286801.1 DNA ligase 1-like [Sparus aurata]XP_030286802.1 DNA ligase 1-like [Sparus aurata]